MTKAREAVLEVLESAKNPLSAADVAANISTLCDTATVYRSLHYLEEQGLAESFVLYCTTHGTERYYVPHNAEHRHWFHCEQCHRFVDLGCCRIESLLEKMEAETGVSIRTHTLYATGLCSECRAKTGAANNSAGNEPAQSQAPTAFIASSDHCQSLSG